jgi:hypothetical protein
MTPKNAPSFLTIHVEHESVDACVAECSHLQKRQRELGLARVRVSRAVGIVAQQADVAFKLLA